VALNQGQWIRIIGKGKWTLPSDEPVSGLIRSGNVADHAFARVSLYQVETLLTATTTAMVRRCLQQAQGESVPLSIPVPQ
jgi:hypothetical protein